MKDVRRGDGVLMSSLDVKAQGLQSALSTFLSQSARVTGPLPSPAPPASWHGRSLRLTSRLRSCLEHWCTSREKDHRESGASPHERARIAKAITEKIPAGISRLTLDPSTKSRKAKRVTHHRHILQDEAYPLHAHTSRMGHFAQLQTCAEQREDGPEDKCA